MTHNSPVNELVTEIGSGQLSLTGEETSFFISIKKQQQKTFFPLLEDNTWPSKMQAERFKYWLSVFKAELGKKLIKSTLGLFLLKSPSRSKIFESKTRIYSKL